MCAVIEMKSVDIFQCLRVEEREKREGKQLCILFLQKSPDSMQK